MASGSEQPPPPGPTAPAPPVGIAPPTNRPDPGWKYVVPKHDHDTNTTICLFCSKEMQGGITRAKEHLMGRTGNVKKCPLVSEAVSKELWEYFNRQKEKKVVDRTRVPTDLDLASLGYGESESEDELVASTAQARRKTNIGTKNITKSKKGPMDLFVRNPEDAIKKRKQENFKQANIRDSCDKETTSRVHQYIAHFWYQAGLSFNAIKLSSFEDTVQAIGFFGQNLRVPSYHETGFHSCKRRWI